jgi:hypothetical protein
MFASEWDEIQAFGISRIFSTSPKMKRLNFFGETAVGTATCYDHNCQFCQISAGKNWRFLQKPMI